MPAPAGTSLTDDERLVVERLVQLMRERLGSRLRSIWLYGSRARGELPAPDSDIDVLAIADPAEGVDDVLTAILLVDRAAEELGAERPIVSVRVRDSAWLEGRRHIESFFIQEVDRDKVVLYGEP